jgi:hypothetical protein
VKSAFVKISAFTKATADMSAAKILFAYKKPCVKRRAKYFLCIPFFAACVACYEECSRLCGKMKKWIPACAGMTKEA